MSQSGELIPLYRIECQCGAWRVANTDKLHVAEAMLLRADWRRRPVNGWTCPECVKVAVKVPDCCGTAGPA